MENKKSFTVNLAYTSFLYPFFLLIITILAYGLLLPQLGFYWDDWPWIWFSHLWGKSYLLAIDHQFRPLSGVILFLTSLIAGEKPLIWQSITLTFRWLSAVAFYSFLEAIFPNNRLVNIISSILFLVYPAYTHQYVSVNSSRHILPYVFFLLSLCFMVKINQKSDYTWQSNFLSITFMSLAMLSTEYYYGLELIRPLILWIAMHIQSNKIPPIKLVFKRWLPYAIVFFIIGIWRFGITRLPNYQNYPVELGEEITQMPMNTIASLMVRWLQQIEVGLIFSWTKIFAFPQSGSFGIKKTIAYAVLTIFSFMVISAFLIWKFRNQTGNKRNAFYMFLLGMAGLMSGGLPFLAAGLKMDITFPASRMTLPMAFGSSLFLAGLIDFLSNRSWIRIGLASLLASLAIGAQFQSAVEFQRDWAYTNAFFQQLSWRVPELEPGTTLVGHQLAETHSTDNSLTAPINWLYFPNFKSTNLPLMFYYLDVRIGRQIQAILPNLLIKGSYGPFNFQGSTNKALIIVYEPPACLRVLHPLYDQHIVQIPELNRQALKLSNLNTIITDQSQNHLQFPAFMQQPNPSGWCYYFERADLARQEGNWNEVVRLAELAFRENDSPNRADERIPFIQGYAFTGDWEKAVALTLQTAQINKLTPPMLCHIWDDIDHNTPPNLNKETALQTVQQKLHCTQLP